MFRAFEYELKMEGVVHPGRTGRSECLHVSMDLNSEFPGNCGEGKTVSYESMYQQLTGILSLYP